MSATKGDTRSARATRALMDALRNGPNVAVKQSLVRRGKRPMHYGTRRGDIVWTGPVERRDPRHYARQAGDVGIRKCSNRLGGCALWIRSDATRCPHCHERQTA